MMFNAIVLAAFTLAGAEKSAKAVMPEASAKEQPKELKVLMLGNSFSLSVGKEMPKVAKAMGFKLDLASIKEGASSLQEHWNAWNSCTNAALRPCRFDRWTDGVNVVDNKMMNMREAVALEKWDIITLLQASHFSWKPETYQPYATNLQTALRAVQPQAEFVWQETWSYTPVCERLANWHIGRDGMYARLHQAYAVAAKDQRIIPMGAAIQMWRHALPVKPAADSLGGDLVGSVSFRKKPDGSVVCSGDTIHLNREGEYFQALVWTAKLFGADVRTCSYVPDFVSPEKAALMKKLAMEVGNPDLRFGVISDIHLIKRGRGDENTLLAALEYFRDRKADGVVIAGDISMSGWTNQLVLCGETWNRVFPGDRAPDGRHVEKLFVYGDHDSEHWKIVLSADKVTNPVWRTQIAVPENRAAAWEQAFGEKYEPIWMKSVKGFKFVGAHFPAIPNAPAYLKAHAEELKGERPFFYIQHRHPKDTCMGAWAWGHDNGESTKALSMFPNAVAFSGHSHYTLTDERSVWQGAFTSFNTASLFYTSRDFSLRENFGCNAAGGYRGDMNRKKPMATLEQTDGRHGMLFSVYGTKIVVERRDFAYGRALGPDWVLDIPGGTNASFAARAALRSAPEFDAGAVATVTNDAKKIYVSFPAARPVDDCRPYEYELTATLIEDDVDLIQLQRRMMSPEFYLSAAQNQKPVKFAIWRNELTLPGHYVFTVRPVECFGKKGLPIQTPLVYFPPIK